MEKSFFYSPIGILEIVSDRDTLLSLKLVKEFGVEDSETDFIRTVKKQLKDYFLGICKTFDIKLNPCGTEFQKRVWSELVKIPYGEVKSYSDIAKNIGNKNAQRAVGSACNKNPIMIIIPCHRVVSKRGSLGGFAYGTFVKEKLLNIEKSI